MSTLKITRYLSVLVIYMDLKEDLKSFSPLLLR